MFTAHIQQLFEYNQWANHRVWDCIMQLTDEQFTQDLDYSVGSLHVQCVHTMGVEHWWVHFLRTGELDFLKLEDYPDRASIRAKWDTIEAINMAYVGSLTQDDLMRDVRPDFWEENEPPIRVWQALLQVTNHSTDHRAQMLAGLHKLGAPTVEQDYLEYLHR